MPSVAAPEPALGLLLPCTSRKILSLPPVTIARTITALQEGDSEARLNQFDYGNLRPSVLPRR